MHKPCGDWMQHRAQDTWCLLIEWVHNCSNMRSCFFNFKLSREYRTGGRSKKRKSTQEIQNQILSTGEPISRQRQETQEIQEIRNLLIWATWKPRQGKQKPAWECTNSEISRDVNATPRSQGTSERKYDYRGKGPQSFTISEAERSRRGSGNPRYAMWGASNWRQWWRFKSIGLRFKLNLKTGSAAFKAGKERMVLFPCLSLDECGWSLIGDGCFHRRAQACLALRRTPGRCKSREPLAW